MTEARKTKKLTQSELANALGVHRNTIAAWENLSNSREPGVSELERMAKVLDCEPDQFYTGHDAKQAQLTASLGLLRSLPDRSTGHAILDAITSTDNPLDYDRLLWDRAEEELQSVSPRALRTARDYLALSLADVAKMSGIPPVRLTEIETGQGLLITQDEVMNLRSALGVAFDPRAVAYSGLSLATNVKDRRPAGVRLQESRRIWQTECQRVPNKLDSILAEVRKLRREVEDLKKEVREGQR